MKTVAVLMTCHNRKENTLACLEYLYAATTQVDVCVEVYLVDDGSTDGTADAVRKLYAKVRIIEGDGNLYWNRGMRKAWEVAADVGHDYYLWLNDDTNLSRDGLIELIAESVRRDDSSLLCGTTDSLDGKKQTYGGYRLGGYEMLRNNGIWQPCDYFNGNIVLVPANVFLRLGSLDGRFWHALGDFDYGLRAKKKGISAYVSPRALGKCDSHENLPAWNDPSRPISKRWKHFISPTGPSIGGLFQFELRHRNAMVAAIHVVSNIFVFLFPSLGRK